MQVFPGFATITQIEAVKASFLPKMVLFMTGQNSFKTSGAKCVVESIFLSTNIFDFVVFHNRLATTCHF